MTASCKLKWREVAEGMYRAGGFPRTETKPGTGYYLEQISAPSARWKVGYQGREFGQFHSKEDGMKAAEDHWSDVSVNGPFNF